MSESIVFSVKAQEFCSCRLLLHDKSSQVSWLQLATYYYVPGFYGSGERGTAGTHMRRAWAGWELARRLSLATPTWLSRGIAWASYARWPQSSQTPYIAARGSVRKDVEAGCPLLREAWSWQTILFYHTQVVKPVTDQPRFKWRQHGLNLAMDRKSGNLSPS